MVEEWSFLCHGSDFDGVLGGIWSAEGASGGCEVDILKRVSTKLYVNAYLVKALTKARCNELKR